MNTFQIYILRILLLKVFISHESTNLSKGPFRDPGTGGTSSTCSLSDRKFWKFQRNLSQLLSTSGKRSEEEVGPKGGWFLAQSCDTFVEIKEMNCEG